MTSTNSALRSLLLRIGLDTKEVEVYLALLALGSARATDIAKAAKQSRSHTYLMLRSLAERGLASEVVKGKVLSFVAAPPERLLSYLDDREKEIATLKTLADGALPQLKALTKPLVDAPRVTLLKGAEGMKQIYREVLRNTFIGLFNAEAMYQAFDCSVVQMIMGKNAKMRGQDLLVDNDGAKRFIKENEQDDEYEIRLLPKGMTFDTDTMIYDDVVILFAYDAENTIIRIQNKNIADSFRSWHAALWKLSTTTS